MNKLLYIFGIPFYITILLSIFYIFYLLFWPFQVDTFKPNPIPILNPNKTVTYKDPVLAKVSFCIYSRTKVTSQRVFHQVGGDQRSYSLNPTEGYPPRTGCRTVTSSNYKVPRDIPPGKYYVDINLIYHVNPLRDIPQTISTEVFTIK